MVDKLHEYEGFAGRVHDVRDKIKERWEVWKEWKQGIPTDQGIEGFLNHLRGPPKLERTLDDYAHVYRKKTRGELVRVSAAVMGIEFSYAAETAFVSPTLLKIGVDHQHMTLVWALSPLIGFFVTPILGSLSDRCRLKYGRRRPFIMLLAIGVLIGLILVPNGEDMGYAFGDTPSHGANYTVPLGHRTTAKQGKEESVKPPSHSWGIFFTILGTVLLDFDADACQSPARAYLLDVTTPEDHAKGLSTFTIMAGLGGFMGYGLGGINWDATAIGVMLGGHLHATFTLITIIFIICVFCTITSFKEIPLELLERDEYQQLHEQMLANEGKEDEQKEHDKITTDESVSYGTLDNEQDVATKKDEFVLKPLPVKEPERRPGQVPMIPDVTARENYGDKPGLEESGENSKVTLQEYLLSIVYMPHSLRMVCLTNLFCWMAHVCYSLYFTDFVGEAVYGGNPQAPDGSKERELYESGVRFGCWGMSMYSLSCSCYSLVIEKLIERYKARRVYICGLLFYSTGMMMMALTKHPVGVIIFSWTAGVMYSTLFTMPYLLVAHYHASSTFEVTAEGEAIQSEGVRGLGTDVAIVSSMVFLAQFLLSCCLGTIVSHAGTTTAVVCVASTLAACGAISATQVMYLDL
ncbi:proton-associated sugar transporter A [Hylaeus anthracinus]|uniref:proton-associated sugar transporter A n=1 Tax=Hylaeus anthracinus TaxID=313031 RepID=UPI0023B96C16|nr:proton-associated sugar transporter A [Hylaeus anthracinus]XP_054015605.1 proton-associated sugar transporter A [Hylaeus anthracinus]XP_054015606.1 proton-associated sugar transporter A [Hylaeus anthracinus]XP_054015607.1 proton-associated sugar transporter A [Hylaeus anthracinus]XP_054015608.1 proton-associated sugar transporter A [Hylaeus anthracinus]XP_054015609.1 proton-associated sugar transporter A [Hylaeus anthracinus]XP_054015611.1 proton-associated sugar transporter A [Hylaeus ant